MRAFAMIIVLAASWLALDQPAMGQAKSGRAGSTQSMNPDTSVNILTKYQQAKRKGEDAPDPDNGFSLEEVELQFVSDIDPYLRASALLSIHKAEAESTPPPAPGATPTPTMPQSTKFAIEPEEVFVETISLPALTLRAGRFKAAIGRHNMLHTHAFPFLDAPIINQQLLGSDGISDAGVAAALLLPTPWYSELTGQVFQGESTTLFASDTPNDSAKVARWRNLLELSDALTFDLGLSGANGANQYGGNTTVTGQDVSLKWRPSQGGKYTSLTFATEALQGDIKDRPEGSRMSGFASWLQYQFAERWWLEGRGEQAQIPQLVDASKPELGSEAKTWTKVSALIGFNPSEFSGFRVQVDQLRDAQDNPVNRVALQMNTIIGAHPAHSY